jgi:hypothetical protein
MQMLLDRFRPAYEFSEQHEMLIDAPKAIVRRAVEEWQPAESWLWRVLLIARGLGSPQGTLREWAERGGFLCLADTEEEIVYGQAGRFWEIRERSAFASPRTVEEFLALDDPRSAVAVANFRFEALGPERTRLSTETRVRALAPHARRRFRLYWLLVRPFSGLLRRAALRGVRKQALALASQA